MDKSPEAFRTISEVAEDLDLPQHVLRFWESRFPQIKPMKRAGGRRYYRPDDVALLRGIRHLLYGQGYTIRGVQRILRERGLRYVQTVWEAGVEPAGPEAELDELETDGADEEPEAETAEETAGLFGFLRGPNEAAPHAATASQRGRRIEPTLAPAEPRRSPVDASGARPEARPSADPQLRAVLEDLAECRRLLDAALQDQE